MGGPNCSCQRTDPAATLAAATEPLDAPFPVPAYPPLEWFTEKPDWLVPGTKLSIGEDGRVGGYFYDKGQCLVHNAAACPQPSPTGYAAFHQNDLVVEDGSVARVGVIGNVGGHANEYAPVSIAQAHYANPDRQIISCRAYDDEHGGYVVGALVPHATFGDVALARRAALSGDWRPMPDAWWRAHNVPAAIVAQCEGYDGIGPTLVTRPGLPLVRRYGARAAVIGGLGGISEVSMDGVTLDLPGGGKLTLPEGVTLAQLQAAAAGPVAAPDAAMQAALEGDPALQAAAEIATDGGRLEGIVMGQAATIAELQVTVEVYTGIVRSLLDAMDQTWAASLGAELPVPELPAVAAPA